MAFRSCLSPRPRVLTRSTAMQPDSISVSRNSAPIRLDLPAPVLNAAVATPAGVRRGRGERFVVAACTLCAVVWCHAKWLCNAQPPVPRTCATHDADLPACGCWDNGNTHRQAGKTHNSTECQAAAHTHSYFHSLEAVAVTVTTHRRPTLSCKQCGSLAAAPAPPLSQPCLSVPGSTLKVNPRSTSGSPGRYLLRISNHVQVNNNTARQTAQHSTIQHDAAHSVRCQWCAYLQVCQLTRCCVEQLTTTTTTTSTTTTTA